MDIEGIRFVTIHDKAGGLIDLRMFFTATNGPMSAIYVFDKKSSTSKQDTANQVIDNAKTLTRMKESVKIIGKDGVSPVVKTQRVTASYDKLVPKGEGRAKILIGKVAKGQFSVRLSI